ncbi:phosphoglucan phosphatase LSF1, chloroplastic [Nymphaea colorata]|nr:phosphoglucan phosphatase LSF1, chloroplastic [Nymphaea colorata]
MNLLQIPRASLGLHLGENPNSWRNSSSSGLSSSLAGGSLGIGVDGVAPTGSKFLVTKETKKKRRMMMMVVAVVSSGDGFSTTVNLNEYMVTLEKPFGIRIAQSVDGTIFVHALKKGGNAEKSRMIMVGDRLKKAAAGLNHRVVEIKNFRDAVEFLKVKDGPLRVVLERPFSPFPIHQLHLSSSLEVSFNRGRVPFVTWNKNILTSNLSSSSGDEANSGFALFSPKFMKPEGWKLLLMESTGAINSEILDSKNMDVYKRPSTELIDIYSGEEIKEGEWHYGSFPLEEYVQALRRSEGELIYNHFLGMQFSKITEQIYIGSCVQTEADVHKLSGDLGITAILNFQSQSEMLNWGINSEYVTDACRRLNVLMINYPIRDGDSIDLRKKMPFCVGVLYRLMRQGHRVYVTCTTGFDRSPASVISYLHWIQDTPLHEAYNFVTKLHVSRPDRPTIVWATWDLIAMVEKGTHNGPPTHAVNFVWSHGHREGEDVYLVGDFTGNWKEPIKAVYRGGSRYEVEVRLPQGRYAYKFIVNGTWRHSAALPTETDQWGNVNNTIRVGGVATGNPFKETPQPVKDLTVVRAIERKLTEDERCLLAFAARRIALSICPIRYTPK